MRTGVLHMKTAGFFSRIQDGEVRGDVYEGSGHIYQPDSGLRIQFTHPHTGEVFEIDADSLAAPTRIATDAELNSHIFCMTTLLYPGEPIENAKAAFETIVTGFKDSEAVIVIKDLPRFLERSRTGFTRLPISAKMHEVKYIDDSTHNGRWGLTAKPISYSWQREVRIITPPSGRDVLEPELGPLDDCAEIFSTRDFLAHHWWDDGGDRPPYPAEIPRDE